MKPPPVVVVWGDAHGGDLAWDKITGRHEKPERITTVGHLVKDGKRSLVVALSRSSSGDVDCYVSIPRSSVISIRRLR